MKSEGHFNDMLWSMRCKAKSTGLVIWRWDDDRLETHPSGHTDVYVDFYK